MKKWNKVIRFSLLGAAILGLAACGKGTDSGAGSSDKNELEVLKIGATSTPHAEILEQVKTDLKEKGYDLEITVFDDYVLPNLAVEDGSLDANFFQHQPYLEKFNEENNTNLVSVAKVHFEPLGIYPGKTKDLTEIAEGAQISIPNDSTNGGRALLLLEAAGLIELKEGVGISATVNDITKNDHKIEIVELEAAQLPRSVGDVDFSVINANYALEGGFNVEKDALKAEDKSSDAAETFGNVIAVRSGEENESKITALVEALKTDKISKFINDQYEGSVISLF